MASNEHLSGHARIETSNFLMIVLITLVVAVGGLVEIVPLFFQKSTTQPIEGLKPYTALQVAGRDVYVKEGCYNCHSQMIRPFRAETERYGHYSVAGEFIYDHPFQWGSRRIGPDLHRVGGKYPHLWHVEHMRDPQEFVKGSIMPSYAHMYEKSVDFAQAAADVRAMTTLGIDYADVPDPAEHARGQAGRIAAEIERQGGPGGLADKQIVALIAYLQRLGTDLKATTGTARPAATAQDGPASGQAGVANGGGR